MITTIVEQRKTAGMIIACMMPLYRKVKNSTLIDREKYCTQCKISKKLAFNIFLLTHRQALFHHHLYDHQRHLL